MNEAVVHAKAGAGENWHEFVLWTLAQGLSGVENLSLIPGTVGAAPIQNIGAYGVELSEVFLKLEAINLNNGVLHTFRAKDCKFGYRDSIFKKALKGKFCITQVYFRLSTHAQLRLEYGAIQRTLAEQQITQPTPRDLSKAVVAIRSAKLPDPATLGNAGSFFKNPTIDTAHFARLQNQYPNMPNYPQGDQRIKVPAGWLIEQCGWKGKRVGETGSYEKQALVLVNYGAATGAEILALSEAIQQSVAEKFEIQLEREVNLWGA